MVNVGHIKRKPVIASNKRRHSFRDMDTAHFNGVRTHARVDGSWVMIDGNIESGRTWRENMGASRIHRGVRRGIFRRRCWLLDFHSSDVLFRSELLFSSKVLFRR